MATRKNKEILKRQIEIRNRLWPEVREHMLWDIGHDGWVSLPRLMPLMMSIMDDLSGKGFPVSRTYLEMWARLREEQFLTLNRPEEMAFHAGFEGQRALRTWKDRVNRLAKLGFIGLKAGPIGDLSYAIFYNPYHVVKKAYLKGEVQERKWQALITRAMEVRAFDIDDIDEKGKLIDIKEEEIGKTSKDGNKRRLSGAKIKAKAKRKR